MSNDAEVTAFDVQYKVLLLGDSLVGKTSIQRYIAGNDFRPSIASTIGLHMKTIRKNETNIFLFF